MIQLDSVSKVYRTDRIETLALDAITLNVERGEFVSVMGPSGCGKSTLLNLMGLLDEPSSGLDPAGRRELVETLQGLAITQLIITHDLPFALELCERAVILDEGQVVADGETSHVLSDAELLAAHRLEMPFGFSGPGG